MKWIKPGDCESGHCLEVKPCDTGACLELAEQDGGHLLMRATELSAGVQIVVTRRELAAFVQAAKAGQYDHMAGLVEVAPV